MGVNVFDRGFLSQLLVLFPLGKITHDVTASLHLNVRIKNFGSEANVYTTIHSVLWLLFGIKEVLIHSSSFLLPL